MLESEIARCEVFRAYVTRVREEHSGMNGRLVSAKNKPARKDLRPISCNAVQHGVD